MKPLIVLITDWTYKEGAIMSTKGVMKTIDPTLDITDGTHEIPQYDIWSASYRLHQSMRFWPKGTVFIVVVDPGVGTARKGVAALTQDGYVILCPDNGTLTHVAKDKGIAQVRHLHAHLRLPSTTGTSIFHGRDVFGYIGAKVASGELTFEETGESFDPSEIILLADLTYGVKDDVIYGHLEIDDPNFGNVWSNVPVQLLYDAGFTLNDDIHVTIRHKNEVVFDTYLPFRASFGSVQIGDPVAYVNELLVLAFAICQGSFAKAYQIRYGSDWKVEIRR
ncbi:MAG: DNA-directed RNA polymerase subunit delta [Firmicutes bacterium HGW-Firmicutes-20]|jgi:S-adenosylmethionine hydrolase|nr:MAG: DNA-directed RNA polymerase subunit delta [Firmicutes bacterium HGW-Firmicutes-20]PKM69891.1 MAG: DNA-directed RNA polymerase subunit delta [Firmicutes bacterium HGW-Firmicutes-19]